MDHRVRVILRLRCRSMIGGTLPRISAIPFVPRFSRGHDAPPAKTPMMCRRLFEKVRRSPIERRLPDRRNGRSRAGHELKEDKRALKGSGRKSREWILLDNAWIAHTSSAFIRLYIFENAGSYSRVNSTEFSSAARGIPGL